MKGFIVYVVSRGDTLQRIAMKCKLAKWQELAILNSLSYPYIIDDVDLTEEERTTHRDNNIKLIGDEILIPAEYENIPVNITPENLEIQAYGSDLDIISQGYTNTTLNLEVSGELTDNSEGDLKVITGIQNLKQALMIRLKTNKGDLPLHPDYGSNIVDLIGKGKTYRTLIKVKLEVEQQIRSDFRIKDVINVSVTSITGGIHIDCDIIPIDPYSSFKFSEDLTT